MSSVCITIYSSSKGVTSVFFNEVNIKILCFFLRVTFGEYRLSSPLPYVVDSSGTYVSSLEGLVKWYL